jgi:hypothetical protein
MQLFKPLSAQKSMGVTDNMDILLRLIFCLKTHAESTAPVYLTLHKLSVLYQRSYEYSLA